MRGRKLDYPVKSKTLAFLDNHWVLLMIRCLIGGVLIYAGVIKFQDPQSFADSIATFQILPKQMISLLALSLPPFEVIVGVLLLVGRCQRTSALLAFLLTVVFALALGQALVRGLKIDCGCFGAGEPSVWKIWASFWRDILLMAGAWVIYRRACVIQSPATLLSE